jgi:hypothetical protein
MSIFNNIGYSDKTGNVTFNLNFPVEYAKETKVFFDIYQQESVIIFVGKNQKTLKAKHKRICRFCGKSMPDVKFKSDAHFIPEFLGNKEFFSDFECDSCNHRFGIYENDFANFLGISRTLTMNKGKKGIPTFKSPDKNLIIREREDGAFDINEVESNKNVVRDSESMTIKTGVHTYSSISVFKTLVKIGLSMISEEDIEDFNETIKYLFEDNSKVFDNSLISILQHIIPGLFNNYPIAFSYKRKPNISDDLIPNRTFVLLFHNRMIQFFLPYNKFEKTLNQSNAKVKVAYLPPLIDQGWFNKYGKPKMNMINLNNCEKIRGNTEEIKIEMSEKNNNAL